MGSAGRAGGILGERRSPGLGAFAWRARRSRQFVPVVFVPWRGRAGMPCRQRALDTAFADTPHSSAMLVVDRRLSTYSRWGQSGSRWEAGTQRA